MQAPLVAGTFSHGQRVAVPYRLKNTLAALMLAGGVLGTLALVFPAPALAQATGKPLTLKELVDFYRDLRQKILLRLKP